MEQEQSAYSDGSWVATLPPVIFLGGIGVHRFYVGKVGTGILWLLLFFLSIIFAATGIGIGFGAFTGVLLGICVLADFILIATGSFKDGSGNPIRVSHD